MRSLWCANQPTLRDRGNAHGNLVRDCGVAGADPHLVFGLRDPVHPGGDDIR
jgi:hypothetical protein